jgi:hypothetical protein
MVMLKVPAAVVVYRVLDREGSAIGAIIEPRSTPMVGRGARTVLLVRNEEESSRVFPDGAAA